jgi:hypothetical protein
MLIGYMASAGGDHRYIIGQLDSCTAKAYRYDIGDDPKSAQILSFQQLAVIQRPKAASYTNV